VLFLEAERSGEPAASKVEHFDIETRAGEYRSSDDVVRTARW